MNKTVPKREKMYGKNMYPVLSSVTIW